MRIYDISVRLRPDMHSFPGDPKFHATGVKSLDSGNEYELHKITLGNHTGTHIDAPSHFIPGGGTVTDIPLEVLNGRARVVQMRSSKKIGLPEVQSLVLMDDFRLLFKTRNSLLWSTHTHFYKNYIYLSEEAAEYLVENGIKLVGIDYLSIEEYGNSDYPVHKILLKNQVVILEGLNLTEVDEGEYEMSCLPLALDGLDGAPARVILKG